MSGGNEDDDTGNRHRGTTELEAEVETEEDDDEAKCDRSSATSGTRQKVTGATPGARSDVGQSHLTNCCWMRWC